MRNAFAMYQESNVKTVGRKLIKIEQNYEETRKNSSLINSVVEIALDRNIMAQETLAVVNDDKR